jgi:hypothetical protein
MLYYNLYIPLAGTALQLERMRPECTLPRSVCEWLGLDWMVCVAFGDVSAQHTGRKLIWQTNMGTADLRATLGGKKRELVVTTQQMFLLLQVSE